MQSLWGMLVRCWKQWTFSLLSSSCLTPGGILLGTSLLTDSQEHWIPRDIEYQGDKRPNRDPNGTCGPTKGANLFLLLGNLIQGVLISWFPWQIKPFYRNVYSYCVLVELNWNWGSGAESPAWRSGELELSVSLGVTYFTVDLGLQVLEGEETVDLE